jgi:hypothetical protein
MIREGEKVLGRGGKKEKAEVVITQVHFDEALRKSGPSLNRKEVERFARIYREFQGGVSAAKVGKRQTLA